MEPVTLAEIKEIQYLREVEKLENKEIAAIINKNIRRVDYICLKYIKYRYKKNFTNEEKIKIIKMFESGYTKEQIAVTLNRTYYSISSFLTRNYKTTNTYRIIRKRNFCIWSEEEEKYILKNYENKTAIEIAKDLDRTVLGVRTRIIKLRREGKLNINKKIGGYNKEFVNVLYC